MSEIPASAVAKVVEHRHQPGWFTAKSVNIPSCGHNEVWYVEQALGAARSWQAVADGTKKIPFGPRKTIRLALLKVGEQPFALLFPGILKDGEGNGHDLHVDGRWQIDDAGRFLAVFADMAEGEQPLTHAMVMTWCGRNLEAPALAALREMADEHGLARVFAGEVLQRSSRWLQDRFAAPLAQAGIVWVGNIAFSWNMEDQKQAEVLRNRRRQLQVALVAKQAEAEADLARAALEKQYNEEKNRIAEDLNRSQAEKEHALGLLKKQHLLEMIEADAKIEQARNDHARAILAHEVEIARIQSDLKGLAEQNDQMAALQKKVTEQGEQLTNIKRTLHGGLGPMAPWLQGVAAQDSPFQQAEWLVSPLYGLRPEHLQFLGFDSYRQAFLKAMKEKEKRDGWKIRLSLAEMKTRDGGCARIPTIYEGTPLRYSLDKSIGGYVTLINIGTSGRIWLTVPNIYVGHRCFNSGERRTVPGRDLLPAEDLLANGLEYVECGPPGWEHFLAFITPAPLIGRAVLQRSIPGAPIVLLSRKEMGEIGEQLSELNQDQWSVGVLSFTVIS